MERLRRQALAVQKDLQLAENSALILAETLGDDKYSVASAIAQVFEAHAMSPVAA